MVKRSFFPSVRAAFSVVPTALMAGVVVAGLSVAGVRGVAQETTPATTPTQQSSDTTTKTSTTTATDGSGKQVQNTTTTTTFHGRGKKKVAKEDKVVQSKDTKRAIKKDQRADALIGVDAKLPDKQLYDKAMVAIKKGHFDIARLDLQTMLNTYPDSQYQMRAKLAVADSWYKEGGTAALTQAESEYADFRVFFPNVPEAAEAQMRIGDIYFRQMDKPDRDYLKAKHAEEEYRRMLTDYPDSTLVPQAKQRLREVQEVLATRESDIANYYATHQNWAAVIARYQTVEDTYPLFSHMDDTLVGLGDAYEAQARYIRTLKLPEAGKAKLEQLYDGMAADYYRKVVLEHSAAAHVEDARDRLAAMNVKIPEPTAEQVAASVTLENSRSTYTLASRAKLLILHTPNTVTAARLGEPLLVDPKPTYAPSVVKKVSADYAAAFSTGPAATTAKTTGTEAVAEAPVAAIKPAAPAAPLALQDVTAEGSNSGGATTLAPVSGGRPTSTGGSVGVEILPSSARPDVSRPDTAGGLKAVGPANAEPLPAIERAGSAPDRPNEITAPTAAAQAPRADGKKTKPEFDKADESSSKHKKKKGLKKIVPPNPLSR